MIYIRTDANRNIGMGHVMRCLSIADAMRKYQQEILFILADDSVKSLVETRGYKTFILESDYYDMEKELGLWPKASAEYILVDSYYVTAKYLICLHNKAKTIYIDDRAAFPYPVDVLVNYNAYGLYIDYNTLYDSQPPKLVLGTSYAPLRSMFCNLEKKLQKKNARDVLISTGGSDSFHFTLNLVKANLNFYNYHILIGGLNPDKDIIRELAKNNDNIILHENVDDMKSLISSCDIAVSAAGSTLYEICACGVPLITYSFADNQIPGAVAFEKLGLAVNIGDIRDKDAPEEMILKAVETLCMDYPKRDRMGRKMQRMIDGCGADRLAHSICEL